MDKRTRRILGSSKKLSDAMQPWLRAYMEASGPTEDEFRRWLQTTMPHLLEDDPRDHRIQRAKMRSPWTRPGMTASQEFRAMIRRSAEGDTERYLDD